MAANPPVNLWTSPDHARDYLVRADSISHRAEGEAALLEFIPEDARRILDLGTGDGRVLALVKKYLAERPHGETEAVAIDFSPSMLEAARKRFAEDSSVTVVAHNFDEPLTGLTLTSTDLAEPKTSAVILSAAGSARSAIPAESKDPSQLDCSRGSGPELPNPESQTSGLQRLALKNLGLESLGFKSLGKFDAVISCFAIHHVVDERKHALYAEVYNLLNPGGVFCNLEHVASPTPRLHEEFLHRIGYTVETEDPSNKLLDVETQLQWLREIGFEDVDSHWKWRELALLAGRKP